MGTLFDTVSLLRIVLDLRVSKMNQFSGWLALGMSAIIGSPIAIAAEMPPAKTMQEWIAQVEASSAKVTDVQLNSSTTGLEIILQTADGKPLSIAPSQFRTEGNALIAAIPAVLALPDGRSFAAENVAKDIASVQVTQQDAGTIRVTVVGIGAAPQIAVTLKTGELVYALKPMTDAMDEEEITITGSREDEPGYRVPSSSTATGTDTPILETPFSVQVVPQAVIRDQQATQIKDALGNVSGVSYRGDVQGRSGNTFVLRGFSGTQVLRDGVRRSGGIGENDSQPISEISNLEQVEVLKGPASILYGEIEPGGVINLVSKQPFAKPFAEVEVQTGSRGLLRPRFDFTGPLDKDGRVLYRLNGSLQTLDSVRTLDQEDEKFAIAPAFTLKLSDQTTLNLSGDYIKANRPADFGLPSKDGRVIDVPRDRIVTEPNGAVESTSATVGYKLEHRFNPKWKLNNGFRYSYNDYDFGVVALPLSFDAETNEQFRLPASQDAKTRNYSLQTSVFGEFSTGKIEHKLLAGFDYVHRKSRLFSRVSDTPSFLDVFNPVYGLVTPEESALPEFGGDNTTVNGWGFFLQDQVSVAKKLKLLAGLRYDAYSQKVVNIPGTSIAPGESKIDDGALTPRFGLLYQLSDQLSLYGSYSQSFAPNTGTTALGQPLDPQRASGFEAGIKTELLDKKLLATLAYFDITKQNVAVTDPDFPLFSKTTGEQRSRGIEVDLSGELSQGWNVIASYSYTDAKVTADTNVDIIGNRLFGAPKHAASLWTTYEIGQGDFKGLGIGAGLNYVGDREGDSDNTFRLGSYFTTNAALFYKGDRWRAGLNFKNIGNVKYVESSFGSAGAGSNYGDPFTVLVSLSFQF
jgi:iron complex outermembrane recepter protein